MAAFGNVITLPKAANFYNGGLWGNSSSFCCPIQLKFRLRVGLKRWNDRGEFELDWTKSKNNIAENSVALGYETDNTKMICFSLLWSQRFCITIIYVRLNCSPKYLYYGLHLIFNGDLGPCLSNLFEINSVLSWVRLKIMRFKWFNFERIAQVWSWQQPFCNVTKELVLLTQNTKLNRLIGEKDKLNW